MVIVGSKYFHDRGEKPIREVPTGLPVGARLHQFFNQLTKTYVHRSQMPVPPRLRRRHHQPRLVAESLENRIAAPAFLEVGPDGPDLRLRAGVQDTRPRRAEERSRGTDDR